MILDVDTGTDDAMALLLAFRTPLVKVLAVTCVNGNSGIDEVVNNTLRVLDVMEVPENDVPVARGFGQPLIEPVHHETFVHGEDGLADLQPPLPDSSRRPDPEHAVQVILRVLRRASEPVVVVALGPLTNIAVAIRTDPSLWRSKCKQLVWMGGSVSAGGNKTAWSEFNAASDPEAAHIVLSSCLPILMYPWDVFLKPQFSDPELARMGFGGGSPPWCLLANKLLRFLMKVFNSDSATIGDAGAVVAALLPSALTVKQMHVEMELQGAKTRGMTVCDMRPSGAGPESGAIGKVSVVTDVDAAAIKEFFKRHVLTPGREPYQGAYEFPMPPKRPRSSKEQPPAKM